MTIERVTAELAIRNLVARYADAVTRGDGRAWLATWAADGAWQILGQKARGRTAVSALWEQLTRGFEFVVQLPVSGSIRVDAETAMGRWTVIEQGKMVGGGGFHSLGIYDDLYRCEDGEWRFDERRLHLLYVGPPDLSAPFNPYPEAEEGR